MEVLEAKPPIPGCDRRREFLDVFGTVLLSYKNFNLAYKECVGGRMILSDPIHQKALSAFSESAGWFKKIVLVPFGATSAEDLFQKAKQKLSENSNYWDNKVSTAKAKYEAAKAAKRKA
jgi:hypothetical protein